MTDICEVSTCDQCRRGFVIGEDGEGNTCDQCRDILIKEGAWGHPFQPKDSDVV